MRLGVPAAAVAVVLTSCSLTPPGSSTAAPTRTPTLPPSQIPATPSQTPQYVVLPESCGALAYGADGNINPITCPDGRPNAAADAYLRHITPPLAVLALGPDASPSDVLAAMCGDRPHSTIPIESSAEELVQAENDWQFNGWGADYQTTYLVNGGCSS